jgi:hypothetical protein
MNMLARKQRRVAGLVGLWLAAAADEASKQTQRGEGDVQRTSAVGDVDAGGAAGVGEGEREMSTTDTGQPCQHVDTPSSHWRRVTREMSINSVRLFSCDGTYPSYFIRFILRFNNVILLMVGYVFDDSQTFVVISLISRFMIYLSLNYLEVLIGRVYICAFMMMIE